MEESKGQCLFSLARFVRPRVRRVVPDIVFFHPTAVLMSSIVSSGFTLCVLEDFNASTLVSSEPLGKISPGDSSFTADCGAEGQQGRS